MKKIMFLLALFATATSFAQQAGGPGYNSAIGAKISTGLAFTYKKFITGKNALEGQAMFFREGIRFAGLYEFHFNIEGVDGLSWYVGPGAHVGFWKPEYKNKYNSSVDLGVDGVLGLDYKFRDLPLNLSLDWQPGFSVLGDAGLQPQFGGLAIRYVLQ
jgi:hypothetical protein